MKNFEVSRATIGRIPMYLKYLKDTKHCTENISATIIAKALSLGEVQVRKDLSAVSGAGRPKTGYKICDLVSSLENFLKLDQNNNVVIVGAGKLGRALLDYTGFYEYGLDIVAAFDKNVTKLEKSNSNKPIYSVDYLEEFLSKNTIKIGIIAVPADCAQEVCDKLVLCGVRAIMCFAQCSLNVPKTVNVQYENIALSLAYLNKKN